MKKVKMALCRQSLKSTVLPLGEVRQELVEVRAQVHKDIFNENGEQNIRTANKLWKE